MQRRPFFYRESHGIRVTVRPTYLPEQSRPHARHYVFAYYVRIENVGKQPAIEPGKVHEYQSFVILKSPSGHMEGDYHFVRTDDSSFDALIPRFELDATAGFGSAFE